MFKLKRIIELLFIAILLYSFNVQAGMYKCKDAEGGITYSQASCPKNQKTDKVIKTGTSQKSETVDCTYANKFSHVTAKAMKNGEEANDIFNQYGGLNSLSKGTINLINYVYTHRLNEDVSAERIAALTQKKCQVHSFGNVTCEDLPLSYTDRLGGCDIKNEEPITEQKLIGEHPTELQIEQARQRTEEARLLAKKRTDEVKLLREAQDKAHAEKNSKQCKERYQTKIDQLDEQMRKGYSSEQSDGLRESRRNLRKQIGQC